MMSLLSFAFEGALALLMVMLIAYCVKLNRGLAAIRSNDTQINELIARLIEASDRAEASVAQLKAVGVAQERSLRAAIADAEKARMRLAPEAPAPARAPGAPAAGPSRGTRDASLSKGAAASLESLVGLHDDAHPAASPGNPGQAAEDENRDEGRKSRSETERTLLAAIRQARAAG